MFISFPVYVLYAIPPPVDGPGSRHTLTHARARIVKYVSREPDLPHNCSYSV